MRIHTIISCLILCLLTAIPSFSQQETQDPEAKAVLDQLAAKTNSQQSIQANYTYVYDNVQTKEHQSYSGKMIVKGNKFRLDLLGSQVYCDGTTQWTYMPDVKEVNVTKPETNKKDFFLSNPLDLFKIYKKDYKFRMIGEKLEGGRTVIEIDLYPFDIKRPYHRIRLTIDKANMQVVKASVAGKQGDTYEISLTDYQVNKPFADSYFRFDRAAHPDVEVVDLR